MNLKEIKELIDLIRGTEVVEIEVERSGFRIKIRRMEGGTAVSDRPAPIPKASFSPLEREPFYQEFNVTSAAMTEGGRYTSIVSPIVGTFYRAASPDQDPYVDVGDVVKKGQVVCIIEAMKLMNEIESEVDGKIVEILVENERSVEYGEPLFRIEPLS
jgi:acetyl-CoA carboxylase biotin carboxyl carrier protein